MRALGREEPIFTIDRPQGLNNITFLHFLGEINIIYNGELIKAKSGAVIFYSPDAPQYFRSEKPLVHNWMHLSSDFMPYLTSLGIRFNEIYYIPSDGFITEIFEKIQSELYVLNCPDSEIALHYVKIFLLTFSRKIKSGANAPKDKLYEDFLFLRNGLQKEYANKMSIASLASRIGISQSRFFELYNKFFGISPTEDLINIRLSNTKRLLSETNLPIGEISFRCGYTNVYHFTRQFKSRLGYSPKEYRKNAFEGKIPF